MIASLDLGLKDKVAIVAGGGAAKDGIGNGRAASILLADAGMNVMIVDREEAARRTNCRDDHRPRRQSSFYGCRPP